MYLLLADDFTGGNDAGIQFAKCGIDSRLVLTAECKESLPPNADKDCLLAVNANTRTLPAPDGAACINSFIAHMHASGIHPSLVFHKIDSVLRGNPGTEMDAIMDGFGFSTAFLTPAFPKQGRSVVDGILLVNGVPVGETAFAQDPMTPITESSIVARMESQSRRKAGVVPVAALESGRTAIAARLEQLRQDKIECIVFDATTRQHLSAIAETGLAMPARPLFVGSAGLAEAVARCLPPPAGADKSAPLDPVEQVFFICGSAHQNTHDQTAALAKMGVPVIRMPGDFLDNPAAAEQMVEAAVAALKQSIAVLAAPLHRIGTAGDKEKGLAINAVLSDLALQSIRRLDKDPRSIALVMTGGETAYSVFKHLGSELALHKELLPGIAHCTVAGGKWDGMQVVTKAGGFGTPDTFVALVRMLRRSAP